MRNRVSLMSQFAALYLKEVRAQGLVIGLLLVATLGLGLYALSGSGDELSPRMILIILPYVSAIGLPFLLIHAISTEWTGQTHYQLLSLPVPRSMVLLAKVAMVLSVALVIFLCSTAFLHIITDRMAAVFLTQDFQGLNRAEAPYASSTTVWGIAGITYGMLLLPLLGIACAASGVRVMAQRFKGLVTLAVFISGGYFYAKLLGPFVDVMKSVFGFSQWQLDVAIHNGVAPTSDAHLMLLFSALFAAACIGIGALLFEKYVEV